MRSLRAVLFALGAVALPVEAPAQDKPDATEFQVAFSATAPLWKAMLDSNPSLTAAEQFVRTLAADVRMTGRVKEFGDEFIAIASGRQLYGCISFKLCGEKVVPAFRAAKPLGVTDIVEYLLEATCFGFLPLESHRLTALLLLEGVVAKVGFGQLPLSPADRQYLRTGFADVLTTADDQWRSSKSRFPKLRLMAQYADPRVDFKRLKGSRRPLQDEVRRAAIAACAGT